MGIIATRLNPFNSMFITAVYSPTKPVADNFKCFNQPTFASSIKKKKKKKKKEEGKKKMGTLLVR